MHNQSSDGPLRDTIEDPRGTVGAIPEEFADAGSAGEYFVKRVQQIRWELWGLLVDLDAIEGMTSATEMLVPQVIDLLGVVARAEANYVDSGDGDPCHLFESDRGRAESQD